MSPGRPAIDSFQDAAAAGPGVRDIRINRIDYEGIDSADVGRSQTLARLPDVDKTPMRPTIDAPEDIAEITTDCIDKT